MSFTKNKIHSHVEGSSCNQLFSKPAKLMPRLQLRTGDILHGWWDLPGDTCEGNEWVKSSQVLTG